MSSFKNAKKSLQRTHRERSQPRNRKQFGLLEKHKDYVVRAKDFHRKQDHLKLLREKARNRNPDEFYYKMIKTKTRNGVHVGEKNKPHTKEQLKIMKNQDLNYTRMKRVMEQNKIERLQSSLHMIGQQKDKLNKHLVFFDCDDEVDASYSKKYDTLNDGVKINEDLRIEKARKRAYDELEKRKERKKQLTALEQQMQLQKNLMGKGRRMKINKDTDGQVVYKWKKQRKK